MFLTQKRIVKKNGFAVIFEIEILNVSIHPLFSQFTRVYDQQAGEFRMKLNFFSGGGVRPGFPKCGACELTFASEMGGGGACERIISKFGGL